MKKEISKIQHPKPERDLYYHPSKNHEWQKEAITFSPDLLYFVELGFTKTAPNLRKIFFESSWGMVWINDDGIKVTGEEILIPKNYYQVKSMTKVQVGSVERTSQRVYTVSMSFKPLVLGNRAEEFFYKFVKKVETILHSPVNTHFFQTLQSFRIYAMFLFYEYETGETQ